MIAVVVDRDQVAAIVEGELLQVARAGGEDLEAGPVQFGPHHGAPVGHAPRLAGLVHDVQPDVADFPVQAAVGAERHAGDAMTAEGRVGVEALADRGALVEHAVAVGVAQPVDARRDTGDHAAVLQQDAAEDVERRVVVESLEDEARFVGAPVAVGVADAVDPLLVLLHVLDVAGPVLVQVRDPRVLVAVGRRHDLAVEGAQVLHGPQRVDGGHPVLVLTDVERHVVAARAGHVQRAVGLEVDRDRIDEQLLRRPQRQLHALGKFHRELGAGVGREARDRGLVETRRLAWRRGRSGRRLGPAQQHAGSEGQPDQGGKGRPAGTHGMCLISITTCLTG